MPLVSIGMPIYNKPQYLEKAIDSLLAQTFTDFEILISDNASIDQRVQEICERYARRDSRIRYVRQPENIGMFNNFYYVYEHSNAPYFMWASDDDLWEPQFIERAVTALSSDPSKSAWLCQFDSIDPKGELLLTYPSVVRLASQGNKRLELLRFLLGTRKHDRNLMIIYSLFRRETINEALKLMSENQHMRGPDHVFVYAYICRNDLMTDPTTLFHKREIRQIRQYPKSKPLQIFENHHFAGLSRAAAGTSYSFMTNIALPFRYVVYLTHKLIASGRLQKYLYPTNPH